MKIWLDDTRPSPEGWVWVKTAFDAIDYLRKNIVESISLDYCLGPMDAGTGLDVAKFIEQSALDGSLKLLNWEIHSIHPDGCYQMEICLYSADYHWKKPNI